MRPLQNVGCCLPLAYEVDLRILGSAILGAALKAYLLKVRPYETRGVGSHTDASRLAWPACCWWGSLQACTALRLAVKVGAAQSRAGMCSPDPRALLLLATP